MGSTAPRRLKDVCNDQTEQHFKGRHAGGPGCSSELAFFYENGPYHITPELGLELNEYGWDTNNNMIFVDQPINTGFSYSEVSA